MNRLRYRNFMCVWVSMCLCLWWFVWACSTVCLCLFLSLLFYWVAQWFFVHAFKLSEKRSEPVRTHWESLVHTHTGQGLPIITLSGPTGGSHHNRWLRLQKKAAVYRLTLSTTALWQKDRAFKTFGQQETFGRLSYILVTTFTLIFVWQHSHLWQVKKPKINSLSCKFRKEFFHQDQNISLLDLRLPLKGCFTEISFQDFRLIWLLHCVSRNVVIYQKHAVFANLILMFWCQTYCENISNIVT